MVGDGVDGMSGPSSLLSNKVVLTVAKEISNCIVSAEDDDSSQCSLEMVRGKFSNYFNWVKGIIRQSISDPIESIRA